MHHYLDKFFPATILCLSLLFSSVCGGNQTEDIFSYEPESCPCSAVHFPQFDRSLMRGGKSQRTYQRKVEKNKKGSDFQQKLQWLRSSYQQTVSDIQRESSIVGLSVRIPRIIHQIWLGSAVPKKYCEWMKTWMNWLGWEYKLWTDKEVQELQLVNQAIYDSLNNYGAKSDVLRIELLYMLGGVYVDTDFECLDANFFECLHRHVDFYIGITPLEHAELNFNNAIIGSCPGHPLLAQMISDLPAHFKKNEKRWALVSTGPVFITKVIYDYLKTNPIERNLFLPPSIVYPFTSAEVDRCRDPKILVPMKESVAIHYWSKSWVR